MLTDATAGGPTGRDLFDLPTVAIETACLLLSTVFCGLAGIGAQARRNALYYGSMAVTFVLGATFVALELHEFATMIHEGAGPGAAPSCRRSSRWSAATACTSAPACCGC